MESTRNVKFLRAPIFLDRSRSRKSTDDFEDRGQTICKWNLSILRSFTLQRIVEHLQKFQANDLPRVTWKVKCFGPIFRDGSHSGASIDDLKMEGELSTSSYIGSEVSRCCGQWFITRGLTLHSRFVIRGRCVRSFSKWARNKADSQQVS